jgi:hypothetical protein
LQASPAARDLLPVLRRIADRCAAISAISAGEDFVHCGFTPANLLSDGTAITGVIDINPPTGRSSRSISRAIMGYQGGGKMTDMLIRDIPDEVIAGLDARAGRLGLSRSEYVRRRLAQDAAQAGAAVSVQDLARFAGTFADLADDDVMSQAWR